MNATDTGRAVHYHLKAYTSGAIAPNGTFITSALAHHTGQIFFDNATLAAVAATSPYTDNVIAFEDRTTNEADSWYPCQSALSLYCPDIRPLALTAGKGDADQAAEKYDPLPEMTWVGSTIEEGLIGAITIGLNL